MKRTSFSSSSRGSSTTTTTTAKQIVLGLALVLVVSNFPSIAIKCFMTVDWFFPSVDVRSTLLFEAYHASATYLLREKPAKSLPEIHVSSLINTNGTTTTATKKWDDIREEVRRLSNNYRNPVILRQAGRAEPQLQDESFWLREYGQEEVLCGQVYETGTASGGGIKDGNQKNVSKIYCTIEEFFQKKKQKDGQNQDQLYVSGATSIFVRRPELQRLVKAASSGHGDILGVEPTAHQIFMGFGGDGSETHNAMASNIFYQVAGRKSWIFFPPSQTPYLKPQMLASPFAHMTGTNAQNTKKGISPWVNKLDRYHAILEPGDMLFNPSWWWHSVYNLGGPNDLVVGCPVRYKQPKSSIANSPFFTMFLFAWAKLGSTEHIKNFQDLDEDGRVGFEKTLAQQRLSRLTG